MDPSSADSSAEQAMQRPVVSGVSVRHCGHTITGVAAERSPKPGWVVIILPIHVLVTD
jgi:hypothetical protein